MTNGTLYNRVLSWLFLYGLAWAGNLSTVKATFYCRLHNAGGTTLTFYITKNGSPLSNATLASGETYEKALGGTLANLDVIRVWTGNYNDVAVYRTDGGADNWTQSGAGSEGQRVPTSPATFSSGASPPTPDYRLDFVLRNSTHVQQFYRVWNVDTDETLWEGVMASGGELNYSLTDQTNVFFVGIRNGNNGQDFPPLIAGIDPEDTSFWRPMDTGAFTPTVINHTYTQLGPPVEYVMDFTPPDASTNDFTALTNNLTEGTFKAGVQNLYTLQQQVGEKQLALLGGINTNLGGAGLATAATNIQSGAAALNGAASNLASAAQMLSNQAGVVEAVNNNSATNAGWLSKISSTLSNILNKFSGASTNDVAGWQASANEAVSAMSNDINQVQADLAGVTNAVDGHAVNTNFWLIAGTVCGQSYSFDVNPMNNSMVSAFASWFRLAISWLSALALLRFIVRGILDAVQAQGGYVQSGAPGTGVGWGIAVWVFVIVVIVGVLVGTWTLWATYRNTFSLSPVTLWTASPFKTGATGADTSLGQAMWLVQQFFDLPLLLGHLAGGVGFQFALIFRSMLVQVVIRWMPAAIVIGLFTVDAEALELSIYNGRSVEIVASFDGGLDPGFLVPKGQTLSLPDFDRTELKVYDAADLTNVVATVDLTASPVQASDDSVRVFVGYQGATIVAHRSFNHWFWLGFKSGAPVTGLFGILFVMRLLKPSGEGRVE